MVTQHQQKGLGTTQDLHTCCASLSCSLCEFTAHRSPLLARWLKVCVPGEGNLEPLFLASKWNRTPLFLRLFLFSFSFLLSSLFKLRVWRSVTSHTCHHLLHPDGCNSMGKLMQYHTLKSIYTHITWGKTTLFTCDLRNSTSPLIFFLRVSSAPFHLEISTSWILFFF